MKPPSNARQISSAESINLLRFVFIRELTNSEYEKLQQLLKEEKMKKTPAPQEAIISDISDNGTEHRYTNGKRTNSATVQLQKVGRELRPENEAPYIQMVGRGARPQQEAPQNLSTEKPTISKEQFLVSNTHDQICSGLAYYSGGTYNRNGVGKQTRFVAVKGFGSWAIYTGSPNDSSDAIADWGDKVCLETHIKALVNCADIFDAYRF